MTAAVATSPPERLCAGLRLFLDPPARGDVDIRFPRETADACLLFV